MKTYKDFEKTYIGGSDIARLIYTSGDEQIGYIRFIEDGSYSAYIVDAETDIPEHYSLVASGTSWLKIYDDDGLTLSTPRGAWEIYRAGNFGCIIRVAKEA